ncbi:nuclear transport factor 2 family protein [Streptomyces kronopolitis]|uniref:nuclear transport factor 2 family protein n=1 Tax=Streptomyces kronopolitis TaxID=1612435 RepID=UPI003D97FF28
MHDASPVAGDDPLKAHKELVSQFIQAFYNEKDFERAKSLLTEDFANHHPGVGKGRDRTITTFREQAATPFPQFSLTVRRMVAEGAYVWTHSLAKVDPEATGAVVVDIWRVQDGLLAEKWDVGQPVPEDSTADEMMSDHR